MKLQEFKKEIRHHLTMAQEFLDAKLGELPDSNLFKWLVHPESDYNPVDIEFNRLRIVNARQVEIADLASVLDQGMDIEASIAKAEPKQCFRNAWLLSLDFGWHYCEGYFIDAQYGLMLDHAWNRMADGSYVDITGEAQPHWSSGEERLVDTGAYVVCYEIPPTRLIELVRLYSDQWVQWQLMSKIEWFSIHDPDRLKKGRRVIKVD